MSIPSYAAGEFNCKKLIGNNLSNSSLLAHNEENTYCPPGYVPLCSEEAKKSCICVPNIQTN